MDWSSHAEFRSDLRDISPIKVNDVVETELNEKLKKHEEKGDERLEKPGVGTVVLDYNIHKNPGEANVVTVWGASELIGIAKYILGQ